MTPAQKHAWYSLAVVATCLAVLAAAVVSLGPVRAQGAFGMMGLLAFGRLFFRKRPTGVVTDERDDRIRRRAMLIAHAVLWAALVLACVACRFLYGPTGAVPVLVVVYGLWLAFSLVVTVGAIATLAQYGLGGGDAT